MKKILAIASCVLACGAVNAAEIAITDNTAAGTNGVKGTAHTVAVTANASYFMANTFGTTLTKGVGMAIVQDETTVAVQTSAFNGTGAVYGASLAGDNNNCGTVETSGTVSTSITVDNACAGVSSSS